MSLKRAYHKAGKRLFRLAPIAAVAVILAGGIGIVRTYSAHPSDAQKRPAAASGQDEANLTGSSSVPLVKPAGPISADIVERIFTEAGAQRVTFLEQGDVNPSLCMVLDVSTDTKTTDGSIRGSITATITSDTNVPAVLGLDPLDATQVLIDAGLVPNPSFTVYERSNTNPHYPIVTAIYASDTPLKEGDTLRVGTVVTLAYSDSLSEYSVPQTLLLQQS